MADDLAKVIVAQGQAMDVLGHSMGGKAAMVLALMRPDLVNRLLVADIAPVAYAHSQRHLVQAMRDMELEGLSTRAEADAALAARVTAPDVRAFLLQSLDLRASPARWRLNLNTLDTGNGQNHRLAPHGSGPIRPPHLVSERGAIRIMCFQSTDLQSRRCFQTRNLPRSRMQATGCMPKTRARSSRQHARGSTRGQAASFARIILATTQLATTPTSPPAAAQAKIGFSVSWPITSAITTPIPAQVAPAMLKISEKQAEHSNTPRFD